MPEITAVWGTEFNEGVGTYTPHAGVNVIQFYQAFREPWRRNPSVRVRRRCLTMKAGCHELRSSIELKTKLSQQDKERHYFELFRKNYTLPAGEVEYGDKPDVTITCPAKHAMWKSVRGVLESAWSPDAQKRPVASNGVQSAVR